MMIIDKNIRTEWMKAKTELRQKSATKSNFPSSTVTFSNHSRLDSQDVITDVFKDETKSKAIIFGISAQTSTTNLEY